MGRYDSDIDGNPYLNEHGKYAAQFARNHGITIREAYGHPTVKAHKAALDYLTGCSGFTDRMESNRPYTQPAAKL